MKNNYEKQLWKTIMKNNYEKQLWKTIMKNNYEKQLWKTIMKNNYEKQLWKTIMDRSKLNNKTRPEVFKKHFNLKRTFCISLILKTNRGISGKTDHKVA